MDNVFIGSGIGALGDGLLHAVMNKLREIISNRIELIDRLAAIRNSPLLCSPHRMHETLTKKEARRRQALYTGDLGYMGK